MGKKKNQVPVGTLKEQVEGYLFDCISEFEYVSGLKVDRVEVRRHRPIGFGARETMEVNIIIES